MVCKPGLDAVPLLIEFGPPILNPFIGSPFTGIPDNDGAPTALLLELELSYIPFAAPPVGVDESEAVGFCLLTAAGFYYWLLLSMWVRISLVYFNLFVISALLLSNAWLRGIVDLSPFLLT